MINVTVLPITTPNTTPGTSLARIMSQRLSGFATDLQTHFQKQFSNEKYGQELVVYIGYNSNYAVKWKIVNDVAEYIQYEVARHCGNLGYIQWKELELYSFKTNQQH